MNRVLTGLAVVLGIVIVASYGGLFHPLGDSLAVFRREMCLTFAFVVIWTRWRLVWRVTWVAVGLAWVVWSLVASRPGSDVIDPDYTLYQQNMLYKRTEYTQFMNTVRRLDPDVLTLQEVGPDNFAKIEPLLAQFPFYKYCPMFLAGELVLSKHPIVQDNAYCSQLDGIAAMQVQLPQGPLWVVSMHLSWPWPFRQSVQLDRVIPELARIDGPVVLAGDFNSVAWSHSVARVATALDARRVGPLIESFDLLHPVPLSIGIDHVLSDGAGQVERLEKAGADHYALFARMKYPND